MNKEELRKFVEENPKLVSMKPAGDGIFVLKYKKKVFYDSLWNEYLEECRGTVVDSDFNVVSRPFTKVYNFRVEAKAPVLSDDTSVTAYRKVNGFMVAMTWHNGDILVSTTGSTSGEFVDMAKEMMLTHQSWIDWQFAVRGANGYTLMFECVHPNDPHIVPEKSGMYFLGWRENAWDSKVHGFGSELTWKFFAEDDLKCHVVESFHTTIGELVDVVKTVRHEGFILYTADNVSSKIKSPYYLISKWVARNPRTDKLMREDFKKQIDEEYYPLIAAIQSDIEAYTEKSEQERLEWVRKFIDNKET